MRAVVFDGKSASFVQNYPQPRPGPDESLVRVSLATVCNTDREILRGYRPDFQGVMGHEFVGVVTESTDQNLLGRRVVGEINLNCGHCLYCESGRPHHCSERSTLGINFKDGCFAEYLSLPNHLLWPLDDGIEDERAVFTEPLAASLRITEQVAFPDGIPVAIVGDGRLALMICQVLSAKSKAAISVFGKHVDKLGLFKPYAETSTELSGSYEVVIDASGSPSSLASSIALTRSEGTLVMKSTYAGSAQIDMSEIVVRELKIIGSRCGPFEPALELLLQRQVDLPALEMHEPADFRAAFESAAFKAALDFRK